MMVRDLLEEVIEIVKNAGEILKSFYEKEIQIYEKEGIELVTQADFEVQRKLKAELLKLKKDFN